MARPPTASSLSADVALAYGETFGDSINHYEWGLAASLGVTLRNGLYLGGTLDFFPEHETTHRETTLRTGALRFGGALGLDLKMAHSVTGRLIARAGYATREDAERVGGEQNLEGLALDASGVPYAGPGLTLLLQLNDLVYLRAGAQLDFVFDDDIETVSMALVGLGIKL